MVFDRNPGTFTLRFGRSFSTLLILIINDLVAIIPLIAISCIYNICAICIPSIRDITSIGRLTSCCNNILDNIIIYFSSPSMTLAIRPPAASIEKNRS